MAPIFKNRIVKRKLENFDIPDFDEKLEIIKKWDKDYHHGTLKQDKETSREQAFNQDFFIKVLGYSEKPNSPYTLEPKATTEQGQLPDVVLGYFDKEISKVSSVVELKGASVPLDRPQQRVGNMSPIQQAFKYKIQYSHSPFVLASNFYEFRLFQDNQLDYEIWTLDDLVNPEDDYYEFRKFYFLLNAENFTSKSGKTKTEELLSDIRTEEETITKKFYKEYRELRIELLRNIYMHNESVKNNIDFGIEKAQKIIDRIVFVSFCEDRDLLPEHTLQRVLKMSDDVFGSLWSNLKGFFEAIDKGSEKLEIPDGYNGGLFAEDSELNNLKVDDDILRKFANIGTYNFAEDLSVNILGHIFEQSISDLEEIKEKVNKDNNLEISSNIGKRKKDGIFYTPDYIVDYIIKNSLGKYLEEKEEELKKKHNLKEDIQDKNYEKREKDVYTEYQQFLQNIKVLDPACGSGAFLVKVFDYLLEENKRVGAILVGGLFSNEESYKTILKNNIYGVDLNSESVEITKLSLWLKTAIKGKKLTALDENIKVGNSLIDDPKIAGDKAFDWNKEFSEIMKKGGFDVIVGNPPYGVDFNEIEKNYLSNFDPAVPDYEIYYYFVSKAVELLKKYGKLSYIFPNTFLSNVYGQKYRERILSKTKIESILDLSEDQTFQDASVRTIVFIITKDRKTSNVEFVRSEPKSMLTGNRIIISADVLKEEIKNWLSLFRVSPNEKKIIDKLIASDKLDNFCEVSQGLIPYDKYRGHDELTIKNRIWHSDIKKDETFKKELKGGDVSRYLLNWNKVLWISYGDWLAAPRKSKFFKSPRILFREIVSESIFSTFTDEEYYNTPSIINAIKRDESQIDLKYILTIVNSKLLFWYHLKTSPKANKGLFPKILVSDVRNLPIRTSTLKEQELFIKKADEMLELHNNLQKKSDRFNKLIMTEYGIEKWSKKLNKFWQLDFDEFVKALKVKISLSQKDELLKLFEQYSHELKEISEQIQKTDNEIDRMVFKLYSLTEDEIKIIENDN
ncbi:hypothetical protein COB64_00355 [Candidatus Wolfebacteria bacterium]|nr:MAG: hypothetical protein COB64_00355 [Candidatus Wolfebacteria bacterium]